MSRKTGTVVHMTAKGYGFIFHEGEQVFFHVTNYSKIEPPALGTAVSFETAPARRAGFADQAIDVQPVEIGAGVAALSSPLPNAEAIVTDEAAR